MSLADRVRAWLQLRRVLRAAALTLAVTTAAAWATGRIDHHRALLTLGIAAALTGWANAEAVIAHRDDHIADLEMDADLRDITDRKRHQ